MPDREMKDGVCQGGKDRIHYNALIDIAFWARELVSEKMSHVIICLGNYLQTCNRNEWQHLLLIIFCPIHLFMYLDGGKNLAQVIFTFNNKAE